MGQLGSKLRSVQGGAVAFKCPGCNSMHRIVVSGSVRPRWGYNGDPDRPTFIPSILIRTGRAVDPSYEPEPDDPPEVCHSFVTDGRIRFLDDCTHKLAGKTVELPDLKPHT